MKENLDVEKTEEAGKVKKALLVTRVSGFIPQHEMNNVKILQEMGYEVHYATNLNVVVYGKDNSRLEGTGIITHQIDFLRKPSIKDIKKAYKQLKDEMYHGDYDVVHCHMPLSGILARLAANAVRKETKKNVPVIYTVHGMHFFRGCPLKNWIMYPVERELARYTDRLITINDEDYGRAVRFPIRGKAEKINGVGLKTERFKEFHKKSWDIYMPDKEETQTVQNNIRLRYGIPDDHYILVSVGELAPGKKNMVVIDALAELKDLKISYLICGEGQMREELEKRAAELGVSDRIVFAGYVTDTPLILSQSDVFVFPSAREGLPVSVMEAMAAGLPVIASDIRGGRELVVHAKGGYLVHGHVPEDYAVKIRRIFTEKYGKSAIPRNKRRQQMGEFNMEYVKKYSMEVVDKQMRKIYADLLGGEN